MSYKIDAQGLNCPEPVILTKKAMVDNNDIIIVVDNKTAKENLSRLASKENYNFQIEEETNETITIHLYAKESLPEESSQIPIIKKDHSEGPLVYQINSEFMGSGDDELGSILMRAFLHTVTEMDQKPDILILYNSGVKLAAKDSLVIDDLKELEQKGTTIMICGTCTNYYEISEIISAGTISNMYDILETLNTAGKIVIP